MSSATGAVESRVMTMEELEKEKQGDPEANCIGWSGKVFGHNYEARYDTWYSAPTGDVGNIPAPFIEDILEASKERKKTYVHDICTRCGNVIRRRS